MVSHSRVIAFTSSKISLDDFVTVTAGAAPFGWRLNVPSSHAEDPKGGGVMHGARIFTQPTCHHRPDVLGGIGEDESAELLRSFFAARR